MKELPILFSGPMVLAVLEGRKTQTRRIYRPRICEPWEVMGERSDGSPWPFLKSEAGQFSERACPYGEPGDRLWVRESFKTSEYRCEDENYEEHTCTEHCRQTYVFYAATPRRGLRPRPDGAAITYLDDSTPLTAWYLRSWKPSSHMPRWASRLTLEVTEVRVQRLQEISEEDARAEGTDLQRPPADGKGWPQTHRACFERLWESINGKRAPWTSNPWVWAVSFWRAA